MSQRAVPVEPGPGQESVLDYPRPPCLQDSAKHTTVVSDGVVIADSHRTKRVLETSHTPVYYIPPEDVKLEYLRPEGRMSVYTFICLHRRRPLRRARVDMPRVLRLY